MSVCQKNMPRVDPLHYFLCDFLWSYLCCDIEKSMPFALFDLFIIVRTFLVNKHRLLMFQHGIKKNNLEISRNVIPVQMLKKQNLTFMDMFCLLGGSGSLMLNSKGMELVSMTKVCVTVVMARTMIHCCKCFG